MYAVSVVSTGLLMVEVEVQVTTTVSPPMVFVSVMGHRLVWVL